MDHRIGLLRIAEQAHQFLHGLEREAVDCAGPRNGLVVDQRIEPSERLVKLHGVLAGAAVGAERDNLGSDVVVDHALA